MYYVFYCLADVRVCVGNVEVAYDLGGKNVDVYPSTEITFHGHKWYRFSDTTSKQYLMVILFPFVRRRSKKGKIMGKDRCAEGRIYLSQNFIIVGQTYLPSPEPSPPPTTTIRAKVKKPE